MHSIERYGVLTLIFLGVTALAVFMWDGDEAQGASTVLGTTASHSGARDGTKPGAQATPAPNRRRAGDDVVRAKSQPTSRPISRDLEPRTPAGNGNHSAFTPVGPRPGPGTLAALRGDTAPADPLSTMLDGERESSRSKGLSERQRERSKKKSGTSTKRSETNVYVVKAGDTLSEIALAVLGTSKRWEEFVKINPGLDPRRLKTGARLKIPSGAVASGAGSKDRGKPSKSSQAKTRGKGYAVQSGDSLWRIAQAELGDGDRWNEIAKLNPSIDPNKLKVGLRLKLPTGSSATPKPKKSTSVATKTESKKRGRVH